MGRLGAAELSVNGAWHSIYPFDAEKQDVSRKGKITLRPPIRHLSRSPGLICVAQADKQWPHLADHGAQNGTRFPGASLEIWRWSNADEDAYQWLGRRGRAVVLKENLPRRNPPCQAARA
jgi:hypothetical protein